MLDEGRFRTERTGNDRRHRPANLLSKRLRVPKSRFTAERKGLFNPIGELIQRPLRELHALKPYLGENEQ